MHDSKINQDLELIQLIEVARHGSRSPFYDIWDYRYNWTLPLKALTPIGQRQHYILGQEIYKRYQSTIFNNGKFDQNQISVLCTSTDRAQQSALCQLYGIYYQKGERVHKNWQFNHQTDLPPLKIQEGKKLIEDLQDKNLPNSYVPINIREPDNPYLLEFCSYSDGIQKLKKINNTTDIYKQFDEQMAEFKKEFVQKFNLEINPSEVGLKMIADHWDSVICDIYEQIPLPETFDQLFIQKLQFVYDFTQLYMDYQSDSGYLLKMQTTTFFNDVIDIVRNHSEIKFRFYSGSDNNLNGLLIATGHINYTTDFEEWLNPTKYSSYNNVQFSSTIFFEVYKSKSTNKKFIKMLYNDKPVKIIGCSSLICDFEEEFVPSITKQAILPNEIFQKALQKGVLDDNQS